MILDCGFFINGKFYPPKKRIYLKQIPFASRFVFSGSSFIVGPVDKQGNIKAKCYANFGPTKYKIGTVYTFEPNNELDVDATMQLIEDDVENDEAYKKYLVLIRNGTICWYCGTKLINDQFSAEFGNYCPDEDCVG